MAEGLFVFRQTFADSMLKGNANRYYLLRLPVWL